MQQGSWVLYDICLDRERTLLGKPCALLGHTGFSCSAGFLKFLNVSLDLKKGKAVFLLYLWVGCLHLCPKLFFVLGVDFFRPAFNSGTPKSAFVSLSWLWCPFGVFLFFLMLIPTGCWGSSHGWQETEPIDDRWHLLSTAMLQSRAPADRQLLCKLR